MHEIIDLIGLVVMFVLGLVGVRWYAAKSGGRHRDENVPARLVLSLSPGPQHVPLP